MSSRQQEQLEEAKSAGNEAFKKGKFQEAIKHYSIGIDISGKKNPASAVLFSNRALCHIKVPLGSTTCIGLILPIRAPYLTLRNMVHLTRYRLCQVPFLEHWKHAKTNLKLEALYIIS